MWRKKNTKYRKCIFKEVVKRIKEKKKKKTQHRREKKISFVWANTFFFSMFRTFLSTTPRICFIVSFWLPLPRSRIADWAALLPTIAEGICKENISSVKLLTLFSRLPISKADKQLALRKKNIFVPTTTYNLNVSQTNLEVSRVWHLYDEMFSQIKI